MSEERAGELADRLSNFRRLATGGPTPEFPRRRIFAPGARFNDVAIAVGDWYLTQLRSDLNVIRSNADAKEKASMTRFHRILKDQRDYIAHPEDFDRKAEAEAWREDVQARGRGPSADDALGQELIDELCVVMDCVCVVAARIVNAPRARDAWRETAAASPEEEIRAVYANLGRHLPGYQAKHVVLQYNKHPDLSRARSPQDRANVGELVVLGVLAAPLRRPYDEILDEFSLVGDSRASALLLMAHAAQALGVQDSRFIDALREMWEAAQR